MIALKIVCEDIMWVWQDSNYERLEVAMQACAVLQADLMATVHTMAGIADQNILRVN